MIESALYAHLVADAGVTALLGTRIYPLDLPQEPTTPCATYHRVSTVPRYVHGADLNFDTVRIQIDCYADSVLGAKTLADAVRDALSAHSGDMQGTDVQAVLLDNEQDFTDPTTELCRVSQDYRITYVRS